MRVVAATLTAVALTACAGPTWVKNGASQQEFYADQSSCASQAGMGTATMSIMQQYNQKTIYENCMMGRGWSVQR